jgi:hypothetical protein
MNSLILTIGAGAVNYSELTRIPPATRAIIASRVEKKLVPAVFAYGVIGFADALLTVDADRRPKELI